MSETLLDVPICRNNEFQAWVHGPVNLKLWNLSITGRGPRKYSHPNNGRIYPWVNALGDYIIRFLVFIP